MVCWGPKGMKKEISLTTPLWKICDIELGLGPLIKKWTTFCWHKAEKSYEESAKPNLDKFGIGCQTKLWTLTFWTERGTAFDMATWNRSSTERNAAWQHLFKTRAVELVEKLTKLWKMYSDCTRLLPSAALANSELAALVAVGSGLPVKRKIKKRELAFKHSSDAWWFHRGEGFRSWSNLGFRNLAAQKG